MSGKVEFNDDGFKRLDRKIKEIASAGKVEVSQRELFPDGFIKKYTDFDTFNEMLQASGIENIKEVTSEKFSEFVATRSRFKSWQEMYHRAHIEYSKRKLRF